MMDIKEIHNWVFKLAVILDNFHICACVCMCVCACLFEVFSDRRFISFIRFQTAL